MKLKVATTGLTGLVGSRIQEVLNDDFEFIEISQKNVDITNRDAVIDYFKNVQADVLLHLAAYTDVDACELNKEVAWNINVEGTRNLLDCAEKKKMHFIYMSTGFVFDGMNPPYLEDSLPHPISYYGVTKYEGEKIVADKGMTIRIDYPYGSKVAHKKDVVESIITALQEKKPIKGIVDQIFTPTYIDDIAHSLNYLMHNFQPEIYHLVGADSLSGMEVIKTIGEVFDLETEDLASTTYDEFYKNKAPRPKNNIMKTSQNTFFQMKSFKEGLQDLKSRLQ